ncbi:hypothetical protein FGG08_006473 [Glutinoglossum americanum]|uniref:Uncharacterized protein n=1 Tax=Glutinoglossum americanum TaxID=1670608 RepID=A0A9P8I574_9PEZI|nr:hypothetical protein FGG08_006473 [Glutinoglossum americanum]
MAVEVNGVRFASDEPIDPATILRVEFNADGVIWVWEVRAGRIILRRNNFEAWASPVDLERLYTRDPLV